MEVLNIKNKRIENFLKFSSSFLIPAQKKTQGYFHQDLHDHEKNGCPKVFKGWVSKTSRLQENSDLLPG